MVGSAAELSPKARSFFQARPAARLTVAGAWDTAARFQTKAATAAIGFDISLRMGWSPPPNSLRRRHFRGFEIITELHKID